MAYTTLANIKARLGITDSSKDAVITDILTNAIGIVESYCKQQFTGAPIVLTNEVHDLEQKNGSGMNMTFMLRHIDVASIQALRLNGAVAVTVDPSFYKWTVEGRVDIIGSITESQVRNYDDYNYFSVDYTYNSATPPDINEAISQIVTNVYRNRTGGISTQEKIGDYEIRFNPQVVDYLTADVKLILNMHRVRRV